MKNEENQLIVNEIYLSLQGESSFAGIPCVFIRLTGCPLRCRYCDTAYAFHSGTKLTHEEIMAQVAQFGVNLVELTGGEPLAQPGSISLLRSLADLNYTVLIETSGALPIESIDPRVRIILDMKTPGSGMMEKNLYTNIDALKATDEVKFVITDRADFDWSLELIKNRNLEQKAHILFSPAFGLVKPDALAEWVLSVKLKNIRMQLQMHKYIWKPTKRGV